MILMRKRRLRRVEKIATAVLLMCVWLSSSCTFYRFTAASVPVEVKTIYIDQFTWNAEYSDIDFLPRFRNVFTDLTTNRTKLVAVRDRSNADWVLEGALVEYRTELSAANSGDVSNNVAPLGTQLTLNVGIRVKLIDNVKKEEHEYSISDKYVANGQQTLFQIQAAAREPLIEQLSQKLFNQLYANW